MITVEDYNSVILEYQNSVFTHVIDTGLITDGADYEDIKYDFCIVSRETTGVGEYNYTFEIVHELWHGLYYIRDSDDEFVSDATVSLSDGVLTVITDKPSIKLFLKIQEDIGYDLRMMTWDIVDMDINNGRHGGIFYFKILDGSEPDPTVSIIILYYDETDVFYDEEKDLYYFEYYIQDWAIQYGMTGFSVYYKNTEFYIDLDAHYSFYVNLIGTPNLILGKKNMIAFTYPHGGHEFTGYSALFSYLDVEENILLRGTDASHRDIIVDLTGREVFEELEIKLMVFDPPYIKKWILPCEIYSVKTLNQFVTECGDNGAEKIQIGMNLSLNNYVSITHDIHIIGNGKTINLNGFGLIIENGINVTIENVHFTDGDTSILQKPNSYLTLKDCSFTNCISTNNENRGSCIACDIDLDSLIVPDDFTTIITHVEFNDNQSCILHGGQLAVEDCRLHNSDLNYIDKHNIAFLYQVDGNAVITNSIFDIDYGEDFSLCTEHKSIGLAQCIIQCGQTAKINNTDYEALSGNDKLQFFNYPYNNKSHIFVKYYYPKISACVFTTPIQNKEDLSACHTVTGVNSIFKNNVMITRASDNIENTTRKIIWGE